MPKENRQYTRTQAKYSGNLTLDNRKVAYAVSTDNLSKGGTLLLSENKLPVDSLIDLELFLKDKATPLRCKGKVKWTRPRDYVGKRAVTYYLGVEFIGMEDTDKEVLESTMESVLC